ncbi:protein kinase [bacterium]|nr:protein kinase [bacterium]
MADRLGNYEIISELGRGGMGVVYKATDTRLGRTVAVKELLLSNALPEVEKQDTVERFRREAMAAARMSHPNIVTVYDYGQDGDRHYMAMELLDGKSLGDFLEQKKTFSIKQVVDISVQICAALDYAHQAGVVHRDIKPDNIMLAETGTVKLTDFGVARVKSDLPSMTTTGTTLGTIAYISPEQLCDSRLVDGRSDLFSLGALIYEMLTFKTPFDAGNLGGTILNIMNAAPTPPSELNAQVPPKLEAVVMRALKKTPEERFNRAAEMGHALVASLREAEKPAPPKIVDQAAAPAAFTPPNCRHCQAPMTGGARVCANCGRAGTAPLTYSIPTAPNPNRPQEAAAPVETGPRGIPAMPPVSGGARPGIPVMPSRGTGALPQTTLAGPLPGTEPRPAARPVPTPERQAAVLRQVTGLAPMGSLGKAGVGQGEFRQPRGVVFDTSKHLLVADTDNGRIQVFDENHRFLRVIRPQQMQETFRFPRALAISPQGILYVTDDMDYRIYKLDTAGRQIHVWKREQKDGENPSVPGRLIIAPNGHLLLSEPNNHRVLVFDSNEKQIGVLGRERGLQSPGGLALDHKGNILVLDFGSSCIQVFGSRGELVKTVGRRGNGPGEFSIPREITIDRFGNWFVADTLNHRIQVFDPEGNFVLAFGKKGAGPDEFNGPEGLTIGPDDTLYVSDRGNGRVLLLNIQRA